MRVKPDSIADGLSAPFAGEHCIAIAQDKVDDVVLVSEDEIREGMRYLYQRAKLACEARVRCRLPRSSRGRSTSRPARPSSRSCRVGTWHPVRPLVSWIPMKAEIHPDYVVSHVVCSCGNSFETRSTKPEIHVEICSACHPFYTGKQKLMDSGGRVERFQRRLEKAGSR